MGTSIASLKTSLNIVSETYRHLLLSRHPKASHHELKKSWADTVLSSLRLEIAVIGKLSDEKPLLLLGNHISYVDIPLLMKVAPDVAFVAKQEIGKWPVFGQGARAAGTIFVKRESGESRASTRETIKASLREGRRIALFPSGTTCVDEAKPWRRGAFEIAQEEGVLIQPFRLTYTPLREVAYIDRDFFPLHLFQLGKRKKISARIEFHEPVRVVDAAADATRWQRWTRGDF